MHGHAPGAGRWPGARATAARRRTRRCTHRSGRPRTECKPAGVAPHPSARLSDQPTTDTELAIIDVGRFFPHKAARCFRIQQQSEAFSRRRADARLARLLVVNLAEPSRGVRGCVGCHAPTGWRPRVRARPPNQARAGAATTCGRSSPPTAPPAAHENAAFHRLPKGDTSSPKGRRHSQTAVPAQTRERSQGSAAQSVRRWTAPRTRSLRGPRTR